jgi:hypothetical protein
MRVQGKNSGNASILGPQQDLQLQIVALNAQTGQVRWWSTPVKLLDGS